MERKTYEEDAITKRLDILIGLFLELGSGGNGISTRDKIYKLSDLGVSSSEIARILGKPLNYITANLHQRKSGKKAK